MEGRGVDSAKDLVKVSILPYENMSFQIGASLRQEEQVDLLLILVQNMDVFAWSSYDVPGVNPEFITHKLNVDSLFPPKKQKPRRSAKPHVEVVKQEVERLKQARAIQEVFFPKCLSNVVVVKKKNGKWWVLMDFTDLNQACPKDSFTVPKID